MAGLEKGKAGSPAEAGMDKKLGIKARYIVALHILLLFYSMCGVCAKLAASYDPMSVRWLLFYGLDILVLGVYAILWQQVIKRLPLTLAFCNKAVSIIWGMVWGSLIFHEEISLKMVAGALIVLVGVVIVVVSDD